jgi:hypothetical protein
MGATDDLRLSELHKEWSADAPPLGPSLGEPEEAMRRVEGRKRAVFRTIDVHCSPAEVDPDSQRE